MKFPESQLAHKLLDGLKGVEIGPSAHNPFGLDTVTAGRSTDGTVYASEEMRLCGEVAKLDYVCEADKLPFEDGQFDFVISSHVLEHLWDTVGTLKEWMRVVKPGGYVFTIFPHKERTFDAHKPITSLYETLSRHSGLVNNPGAVADDHYTIWTLEEALKLCWCMGWKVVAQQDQDDKVGNGFTFVIQK